MMYITQMYIIDIYNSSWNKGEWYEFHTLSFAEAFPSHEVHIALKPHMLFDA